MAQLDLQDLMVDLLELQDLKVLQDMLVLMELQDLRV
jgi:hypothetical protein